MAQDMGADQRVFDIYDDILESELHFLNPRILQLIPSTNRGRIIEQYLVNHANMIQSSSRMFTAWNQTQAAAAILTYALPLANHTFMDPVPVVPTEAQINHAVQTVTSPTGSCAICQEPVSSSAVRLRACGHVFHRSCILQWFRVNVRCPVCRHDIREQQADLPVQTSSASTRTSALAEDL